MLINYTLPEMAKKLLFLLLIIFPSVLMGQVKPAAVKNAPVVKKKVATPVRAISNERTIRLNQRNTAAREIVLLKNDYRLLPLQRLDTLKILVVGIGSGGGQNFRTMMERYVRTDYRFIRPEADWDSFTDSLLNKTEYNLLVALQQDFHHSQPGTGPGSGLNDIHQKREKFFVAVTKKMKVVHLIFGPVSSSGAMTGHDYSSALLFAEKPGYDHFDLASQLLFGAIGPSGKLATDFERYRKGDGLTFQPIARLGYALPEELGMDSLALAAKMDSLVGIGLKAKAFPGCQMLLAKNGKVYYYKCYGYHTYERTEPVQPDDLYDLASVTKILAPLPALMWLADQKKFEVNRKMSEYWPDWKGSNKEGIVVADLLSHQARLKPGIVTWPRVIDSKGVFMGEYCSTWPKAGFSLRVSEGLYLNDNYRDTIYRTIRDSPLLRTKKYAYSDIGFVILPGVVEKLSGENFEKFLREKFYNKLGSGTLLYNPWTCVPKNKIIPTERDRSFRHELLQGFVHDETAGMMGGVSGNAGLFGSAPDVAKMMQLYLQEGVYGGERFISSETLLNWTSSHRQKTTNRRGYGFDKPGITFSRRYGKVRYPSTSVSEESYGHSGFTGTFTWADPDSGLLFVFLSNRVYPDRNNNRINTLKLRPLLLENMFKMAGNKPVRP